MSMSEPREMMLETSKAGVVPKFDMHVHVSTLTLKELNNAIETYDIPMDLHPRLPEPNLTMDNLSEDAIGYANKDTGSRSRIKHGGGHPGCYGLETPRHDVFDDFPINYNEDQADMVAEKIIPLRKLPQSLFLTITVDRREITIDDFLCLPDWTRTVVSKGDPLLEDHHPPNCTVKPLSPGSIILEKNVLQKNAKRDDDEGAEGLKKKRKKKSGPKVKSRSEKTISPEPIHQSFEFKKGPEEGSGSKLKDIEIPRLQNNLRICSYYASRELISHLATLTKQEVLSSLTNYEVLRRSYQSLGRSTLAQAELLKRFEQVNHNYLELANLHEGCVALADNLSESDNTVRRQHQMYEGLSKKHQFLENVHSSCSYRENVLMEQLREMTKERDDWR
ncbi:hypothetical protein Tco_0952812 [Tanacetum coccineum]|uniref:Uncharacterized protein n=1 Tax=Tanacetum coccineum TaxID=301880 RepID=A0ABQ5DY24_9ASTR